jgi:2-keto-4-pentenoate hydratase/2-oxohepta-3-ene-1,7-dioic acid hydratase in catechol pathway
MLGKAIDTFLPCGPWLVTADEIPDPQALSIRCCVNGELMQDSSTANMAFGVASLVALSAGRSPSTGGPDRDRHAARRGMARTPPRWLRDGDEMTVEIGASGA